jgi:hypothetical protein
VAAALSRATAAALSAAAQSLAAPAWLPRS